MRVKSPTGKCIVVNILKKNLSFLSDFFASYVLIHIKGIIKFKNIRALIMKKFLLLLIISFTVISFHSFANNKANDKKMSKSSLFENDKFGPDNSSFPMPFVEIGNPVGNSAVSTGYYFMDSENGAGDFWRPEFRIYDKDDNSSGQWVKIESGPRQRPYASSKEAREKWADPNVWGQNGLAYFRNPAYPENGDWFAHGEAGATDSTDDAIAGPIPLFMDNFYFNGIRYDSFYVSTNGIIALTNRRYYYNDSTGKRQVDGEDCYDPMSMDWYIGNTVDDPDRSRNYEGSAESANPAIEKVPDNYGYQFAVCGGDPKGPQGGIRKRGGSLKDFTTKCRAALIAPFFGDMQLSQYSSSKNAANSWGEVWFRKSLGGDSLIIYFLRISPVRELSLPEPDEQYYSPYDARPGDANYVSASAQVILCSRDSSIVINYENFDGYAEVGGMQYPADLIFRYNSTCGVLGFARHYGYHHRDGIGARGEATDYEQYTHYFSEYHNEKADRPKAGTAVKFKQWKNMFRAVDISYRVMSPEPDDSEEYIYEVNNKLAQNYEILAGEKRIGGIQPVAIFQNLTNEIQGPIGIGPGSGVNYFEQEARFRARFRIYNQASGKPVYNRVVPVDSIGLALPNDDKEAAWDYFGAPEVKVRYSSLSKGLEGIYSASNLEFPGNDELKGIPPYGFVKVYFQPFVPNEFVSSQVGLMKSYATVEAADPKTMEIYGDEWPFDDYDSLRLFSMKRLRSFLDYANEYHNINGENMPSVLKWVNINAEVVAGDEVSRHPIPPRRVWDKDSNKYVGFRALNNDSIELYSPVIKLNRDPGTNVCDELRSFPIDLIGRRTTLISFSVQRGVNGPDMSWDRGWCDASLIGPEPRCIINGDPMKPFNGANSVTQIPDELVLEFAKSSPDGIHGITNIGKELPFIPDSLRGNWSYHPRRGGAPPVTDNAAFTLFGGGGFIRGFLEMDPDSALSYPDYVKGKANGLRPDIYDDGIDYEYERYFVGIPDTFLTAHDEGAKNIRFRFRVIATDDSKCKMCIPDDDDPFYIDNIKIVYPQCADLAITSVKIDWPYSMIPASQASRIPVSVIINNSMPIHAPTFFVKVHIFRGNHLNHDPLPVYKGYIDRPYLPSSSQIHMDMPAWDARRSGKLESGEYYMLAMLRCPGGDMEILNDTTYADIKLEFGDAYAYDPVDTVINHVPQFTDNPNSRRGLCLSGYSRGGKGDINIASGWNSVDFSLGDGSAEAKGQIAVKFELFERDTLKGYQIYFGRRNNNPDFIDLNLYKDEKGLPGELVEKARIKQTARGYDKTKTDYIFDKYINYICEDTVILERGKYWVGVAQLGDGPLDIGGSKTGMGMRTTNVSIPEDGGELGMSGNSVMLNDRFRYLDQNEIARNLNVFCYENEAYTNDWRPFMPESGNPGYAHLHHFGVNPVDNTTWSLSRGTWIPMIRPYFGEKYHNPDPEYVGCDIYYLENLNLKYFMGEFKDTAIVLIWNIELNLKNKGIRLYKREKGDLDWEQISQDSISIDQGDYILTDRSFKKDTYYQYDLKYLDEFGLECPLGFQEISTYKVGINEATEFSLSAYPNPFSNIAVIEYSTPKDTQVGIYVMDIFGNTVRTLKNTMQSQGNHNIVWNGAYDNGVPAPAGTYIVRLITDGEAKTIKLNLLR